MELLVLAALEAPDEPRARHGRPRSVSADEAIIAAAASLLSEVGYRAMCMEAVAARAGVSKATLYRRHHDKEALVTATILSGSGTPPRELPQVGSTRESLTLMLRTAAAAVASPSWLPILGAVFSEGPHEGGLASVMRRQIFNPSAALVADAVRAGVARGEFRATVPAEVVNDVLFGALLARSMLGEEITDAWLEGVVESVWRGFGADPGMGDEADACGDPGSRTAARGRMPNC